MLLGFVVFASTDQITYISKIIKLAHTCNAREITLLTQWTNKTNWWIDKMVGLLGTMNKWRVIVSVLWHMDKMKWKFIKTEIRLWCEWNYIKAPTFSLVRLAIFARVFFGQSAIIKMEIAEFNGDEIQSKINGPNNDNIKDSQEKKKTKTIIKMWVLQGFLPLFSFPDESDPCTLVV